MVFLNRILLLQVQRGKQNRFVCTVCIWKLPLERESVCVWVSEWVNEWVSEWVSENVFNLYEEMPDLNIHSFRL